jgi:hypothetical protein
MDALYLIVHKVRGQPALDIAQRFALSGGEEIWLIPTSGHRAYPFAHQALGDSFDYMTVFANGADWDAIPDHCPEQRAGNNPEPEQKRGALRTLSASLRALSDLIDGHP